MKVRNRTARIKPATRNAVLDQLAAIADGIIAERMANEIVFRQLGTVTFDSGPLMVLTLPPKSRRWWQVWK